MAKCPKCKEEIDYLEYRGAQEEGGNYHGNNEYNWKWAGGFITLTFSCPSCDVDLDIDREEDADAFLAGEKKVKVKK